MERYIEGLSSLPKEEAASIAHKDLLVAGIIEENGNFPKAQLIMTGLVMVYTFGKTAMNVLWSGHSVKKSTGAFRDRSCD